MKDNRVRALRSISASMLVLSIAALVCGSGMGAVSCFTAAATTFNASNVIKKNKG